jgi:7-cyano-7-deazaguanine synthase
MKNGNKALVLLSGGLDSATCLYWARQQFQDIYGITFNYHDRIKQEQKASAQLASKARVTELLVVDIPFIKEFGDSYIQNFGPKISDSRSSTYIPARNLIFYSIALHYAEYLGIGWIVGGHNRHDGYFFRDATQTYITKINSLFKEGSISQADSCKIILPLCKMYRKNIIRLAITLKVPIELTWSCHNKGRRHCNRCYACLERVRSFNSLGMPDPAFI